MLNVSRHRPLGITIIAIIMGILGILGIISGILSLSTGALGIITLILGVLEVILAWGLWTLQPWAFWVTVILEVLVILDGIFAFTQHSAGPGIVAIVVAIIILLYMFLDRNVRAAFHT